MKPSIRAGAGRAAFAAAMLAAVLLFACATPEERAAELQATWRSALVTLPPPAAARFISFGSATNWAQAVAVAGATPRSKVPAVIHLHGCAGRDPSDQNLSAFYASQGYAFFGPSSFARAGRQVMCNRGDMGYRMRMRLEEAQYAREQLRAIDWIDQQRVVLSGYSEGAQGASSYSGDQFAAIVLLGTDCRFVGGGPRAPRNVPVINIVGSADSFGYGSGCITHGAPGSRKLVIPDGVHDVSTYPDAMRALADFLVAVRH